MNHSRLKWLFLVLALAGLMLIGGCKKKVQPAPPAPPPPPPAPTASLTANPSSVRQGEPSTLLWSTRNATDVSIEGIGAVDANGSKQVTPTASTTYRLVAKGEGGTQEATARVTVTAPPPPPPAQTAPNLTDQQLFSQSVKDIYFDYDKYDVTTADQAVIQANGAFLKSHPNITFTIEGHCDERGSTEYNLALGDNRANSARQALVSLGIPAASIRTISYGKEKPVCTESTEQCWQQNRRAHFAYGK